VKILFHVTLPTLLRHFEGVLLALAERGHLVRIAASDRRPDLTMPPALAGHERMSFVTAPVDRGDAWTRHIYKLRVLRDYLRYLEKPYRNAPKLRERALRKLLTGLTEEEKTHAIGRCPRCEQRLVDDEVSLLMLPFGVGGRKNVSRLLALMESTVPSGPAIDAFLQAEDPDVVLVTPLINFGSAQADYVKSAKALGIPVGFPVFSWDNLTNKGLIHVVPDRVFVWNERQAFEATKMQGVPAEDVVVTGAPRFDDFFRMTPGISREDFCTEHRLDPARPILTYLCSSAFVAGDERGFVTRWIDEIRQAPALARCNVVVRPHPRQKTVWKDFVPAGGRVAVTLPRSISTDQTLFDTIHHSAALVGLNTSAQLEAGIVGRPVFTILAPEFSAGQQGTIHFHYLLRQHGGFVEVASDFEAHRQQVSDAVTAGPDADRIRAFIQRFLRPRGLDQPVTPFLVEQIEALARRRARVADLSPVSS
jgi:hypothetical protein